MLIDNTGRQIPDSFVTLADEADIPATGAVILPLPRLLADPALRDTALTLGVSLPTGSAVDPILPWLDRLAVVVVHFPMFRDGRAFTLARELREEHGYRGEIRATGHVLPDQYVFLVRCGVSSVALKDDADVSVWAACLHRQSHPEQPATERALPLLRRIALPFDIG